MTEPSTQDHPPPSSGEVSASCADGGGEPRTRGLPAPIPDPVTLQDMVDVVQAAVRSAKEGDMHGAEVVRRFWRGRRQTIVLDIGEVKTAEQTAEAQARVLGLAFAGALTLREGRDASTLIENRRRALHTLEQQRQLDDMIEFAKQHAPTKESPR
jgi:hypothetical protein